MNETNKVVNSVDSARSGKQAYWMAVLDLGVSTVEIRPSSKKPSARRSYGFICMP